MVSIPPLGDMSIPKVQHLLDSSAMTSTQLVAAYLARIKEIDHEFNSVTETNPGALAVARALDAELATGQRRSCLHGLPILLKDNIPTLDKTETTCGSLALIGARPRKEASVVTALRDAGAVILGKANMAEWVGFRSTSGCAGWSARGGHTYGPYAKRSKASGSSSGSAVATALGMCFAAIGTETCWSIVSPAEKSGVVGFKPTKDLIPSEGIIYASRKQDTVGVLTRSVGDAMHITRALIAQSMKLGPLPSLPEGFELTEFMDDLLDAVYPKRSDLLGIRIGIPNDILKSKNVPEYKLEAFGRALWRLETKGAKVVKNVTVPCWREYDALPQEATQIVLHTDMKTAINEYLAGLQTNPQNINNLQDLIGFTQMCAEEEYPVRNVVGLEQAQATNPDGQMYKMMQLTDTYLACCIAAALDRYNCDVLLIPFLNPTLQTFAAKAGSPVMSVPLGVCPSDTAVDVDPKNGLIIEAPGIPFSVYIFGKAYGDASVLRVGCAVEELMKVRAQLVPRKTPKSDIIDFIGSHN